MIFLLFGLIGFVILLFIISSRVCNFLSCFGVTSFSINNSILIFSESAASSSLHDLISTSARSIWTFLPTTKSLLVSSISKSFSETSYISSFVKPFRLKWSIVWMVWSISSLILDSVNTNELTELSRRFSRLIDINFLTPRSRPLCVILPLLWEVPIYFSRLLSKIKSDGVYIDKLSEVTDS